jgi:hypothetical protein
LNVLGPDELEREVNAHLRGVEHGVVVDDQAAARPVLRDADDKAHVSFRGPRPDDV